MKYYFLTLLLISCFGVSAQISVIHADSVRLGNPGGTGSVVLYGKSFLKGLTPGGAGDSVIVIGADGRLGLEKRSNFSSGAVIGISPTDHVSSALVHGNLIYNTTLSRLRIYDPSSMTWRDAGGSDLSNYYNKTQVDSVFSTSGSRMFFKDGLIKDPNSDTVRLGGDYEHQVVIGSGYGSMRKPTLLLNHNNGFDQGLLFVLDSLRGAIQGVWNDTDQAMSVMAVINGSDKSEEGMRAILTTTSAKPDSGIMIIDKLGMKGAYYEGSYWRNWTSADSLVLVNKAYVDSLSSGNGGFFPAKPGVNGFRLATDATANFNVYDTTSGAYRLVVKNNGHIGIGTAQPDVFTSGAQQVLGVSSASGSALIAINGNSSAGIDLGASSMRKMSITVGDTSSLVSSRGSIPLTLGYNGSPRIRIGSGGVEITGKTVITQVPTAPNEVVRLHDLSIRRSKVVTTNSTIDNSKQLYICNFDSANGTLALPALPAHDETYILVAKNFNFTLVSSAANIFDAGISSTANIATGVTKTITWNADYGLWVLY